MILTFIGTVGGGKTVSAVYEAYKYYMRGYQIYANIHLSFPYTPLDKKMFDRIIENEEQLENAVILIDEAHIWLDSRASMKKKQRAITYFILQTRKRNVRLLCTTQHLHQVDKRLRDTVDILVFCKNLSNATSTVQEASIPVYIEQQFVFQWREDQKPKVRILFANPIFPFFNTRQMVSHKDIE